VKLFVRWFEHFLYEELRLLFENVCVIIRKNQMKVMEEEKYQKELFKFEQPKRSFSRFAEMLPKADFEGRVSITISLEKMVFIAIGLMMVFVIVYAMGVESGKSRGNAPVVRAGKPSEQLSNAPGAQVRPAAIPVRSILNTAPIMPVVKPAPPVRQIVQPQVKATAVYQASKPYTILAGSFAKLENAQGSAAMLAKQGFNVSVTYFQPYYRVSVGSYSDKTSADAQRDLVKVRRINKDAMFKLK
jgi:SPOR domain